MHEKKNYWWMLSRIWDFLKSGDRESWETFWDGLNGISYDMTNKARDFLLAINPLKANTENFEYYFDLTVSPLRSIPVQLDPTIKNGKYSINNGGVELNTPDVIDGVVTRRDDIIIDINTFNDLNSLAIDTYCVVKSNNVSDKFFKVIGLSHKEELYRINIDGDLLDYENEIIEIYLTTGLSYRVDSKIRRVNTLSKGLSGTNDFSIGNEYTFSNSIIEFGRNIFEDYGVEIGSKLYCEAARSVDDNMYNMNGTLVNIHDWTYYNYTNQDAKTAISALMKSLQNSDKIEDYNRALNLYYNMPVSHEDGTVVGLYESYGYKITDIGFNSVTVEFSGDTLSSTVSEGGVISNGGTEYNVVSVVHSTGLISLSTTNGLSVGDTLYPKLVNKSNLVSSTSNTIVIEGDLLDPLTQLLNIYNGAYDGRVLPEFIVYGSDVIDGIYHMAAVSGNGTNTTITIYEPTPGDEYLYNDYLGDDNTILNGSLHVEWPTHKFLAIRGVNGISTHYLDSGIDTKFDTGDKVEKFDVLTRNVSAMNTKKFPGWYKYDQFNFSHGMSAESDTVELTGSIPGAVFGKYLPIEVVTNEALPAFTGFTWAFGGSDVVDIQDFSLESTNCSGSCGDFVIKTPCKLEYTLHPESSSYARFMAFNQNGEGISIKLSGTLLEIIGVSDYYSDGAYTLVSPITLSLEINDDLTTKTIASDSNGIITEIDGTIQVLDGWRYQFNVTNGVDNTSVHITENKYTGLSEEFFINMNDIKSIHQEKMIVGDTYITGSKSNIKYYDVFTKTAEIEDFTKQSNIVIELLAEKDKIPTYDKPLTLVKEFESYMDDDRRTIFFNKDSSKALSLDQAFDDDRFIFKFNSAEGILSVYLNNTYDKGMSGSRNIVNNIRYSGNHILSE